MTDIYWGHTGNTEINLLLIQQKNQHALLTHYDQSLPQFFSTLVISILGVCLSIGTYNPLLFVFCLGTDQKK